MFKVKIIAVGKLKEKSCCQLQEKYWRQLKPFVSCQLEEVPLTPLRKNCSPEQIKKEEAKFLAKKISPQNFNIFLTEKGKLFSSRELAEFFRQKESDFATFSFFLGGPLGFSSEILSQADFLLSLSPLTFPHELARVILWEQLYRCWSIYQKKQYHY